MLEGEIFVSGDTAIRNAKEYQTSPKEEAMLYVIHGILHLIGFKDHKKHDVQAMQKEEQSILKFLKK